MSSAQERDGLRIISDLFHLTGEMMRKLEDEDFLVKGVERRQQLMAEYDQYHREHPQEDQAACKKMVKQIIEMDKAIRSSLLKYREDAKSRLTASQHQQKVMGYMSGAVASSGSYMDYKK